MNFNALNTGETVVSFTASDNSEARHKVNLTVRHYLYVRDIQLRNIGLFVEGAPGMGWHTVSLEPETPSEQEAEEKDIADLDSAIESATVVPVVGGLYDKPDCQCAYCIKERSDNGT